MPAKKKDNAIVAETKSDERSSQMKETGDEALDDVLHEAGAGADGAEIDVESTMGEDAEVEKSAELAEKYADEIAVEASSAILESEVSQESSIKEESGSQDDEEKMDSRVRGNDKKGKSPKSAHVQGPRKPSHSKKYRNAVKEVDLNVAYTPEEALEIVKKTSYSKFDGTVEVHIKLSIQNQRGIITLPAGSGKDKKVVAATSESIDDLVRDIEAGKINFDILIATPDVMPKLSKLAKILGPKGLMPNPKSGTVTADVEKAKQEFAGGRVEFKQDKGGAIHLAIGKVSFATDALLQNLNALLAAVPNPKITSIVLTSTMGPGVKVKLS